MKKPIHHDTSYWDDPKVFDGLYQMDPRPSRLRVADILKDLEVEEVLSVGCGTGPFYEILQDRHPVKFKGTDYSGNLIKIAKKHFKDAEFEVQDMRKMKEKDDSWDAVLAYHALDHTGSWRTALYEMQRVCKRYCIIALWRPFCDATKTNATGFFGEHQYADTYLNEFNQKELEEGIEDAGFGILRREVIEDAPGRDTFIFILQKDV